MTLPVELLVDRDTPAPCRSRWVPEMSPASREVPVTWECFGFDVMVVMEVAFTDDDLLARIADGDAEAFATFYDRHEPVLFGVALRIVQNDREAEDVLQEAAVLVWERAADYRADLGRPMSWAVTLVRNKAIDRLRAGRRRWELSEKMAVEAAVAEEVAVTGGEAGSGDRVAAVRRTLLRLPAEQRRAIELAFFGGLSQTEIADREAAPLGTVKARIRRGMLAMRDALEGNL